MQCSNLPGYTSRTGRPLCASVALRRCSLGRVLSGRIRASEGEASTGKGAGCTPALPGGWQLREERGVPFVTGEAFYRAESCAGRDLAVLAAALHRRRTGRLRVLDVMAGSGMRGARYLAQAEADEVWINDGSPELHEAMVFNLCTAAGLPTHGGAAGLQAEVRHASAAGSRHAPDAAEGAAVGPASTAPEVGSSDAHSAGAPATCETNGVTRTEGNAAMEPEEEGARRRRAAHWESQAQRRRFEGLVRDVWQWELPPRSRAGGDAAGLGATAAAQAAGPAATCSSSGRADLEGTAGGGGPQRSPAHDVSQHGAGCGSGVGSSGRDSAGASEPTALHPSRGRRVRVSHIDANRLLTSCYMREEYYDLIDVDSFGSETMHFPAAIDAVRYGGLLYLTSTDGLSSSGKRPERSLAAYGSYLRSTPWSNEQGLRMLIGAAVREAASRGVALTPVFSLYSYHGPVFRVMLRARRTAEWPVGHYGFMGHCFVHGDSYTVGWRDISGAVCRCETRGKWTAKPTPLQAAATTSPHAPVDGNARPPSDDAALSDRRSGADASYDDSSAPRSTGKPLVLSGPLWTGPLHDAVELRAMAEEAAARGWTGFGMDPAAAPHLRDRAKSSRNVRPLQELLALLLEEADPRLPPGFFSIDDSVVRRLARPPPRDALIAALREEGFAAARCHLEARAFRTNACMEDVLRVAEQRLQIPRRG